ncbi:monocyte to macrophage differentiation factor [Phlebotomus argentipes]|uniref:monocyte to macrophage differentiation factor n=1 Tax=Phlebotomus argentipes TaxID=94469 RepID=UPI0028931190|nr:monocyte to macrophage differentiation factor [Phlebotomus argentipes]XP_059620252.1 monocyte to macrophage differentiation factor [Phlebotomus argentipes]
MKDGISRSGGYATTTTKAKLHLAAGHTSGADVLSSTRLGTFWMRLKHKLFDTPYGQLKNVHWMNKRAPPGTAYTPTEVEHIANVITHGIWVGPAVYAGLQLIWRSGSDAQKVAGFIYGTALFLLFAISTFFHTVFYCNRNRQLKDVLHRCDRAMIYVFIAGSYYPWLTLTPPTHPTIILALKWLVWLLAGLGILYQQVYHEKYKCLETFLYIVMGLGPSIVIMICGHEFNGMDELKIGGLLYILGVCFFKADGKVPCAHAIWHLFVVLAASVHYFAILKHLYS